VIAEVLVLFVQLLRLVATLAVGLILSTRPTKCQVSAPPRGGRIYSCCGKLDEPQAYYWTGTSCAADTFCQCGSDASRLRTRASRLPERRGARPTKKVSVAVLLNRADGARDTYRWMARWAGFRGLGAKSKRRALRIIAEPNYCRFKMARPSRASLVRRGLSSRRWVWIRRPRRVLRRFRADHSAASRPGARPPAP